MATRIYVGHLPESATNEQLTQLFAAFGDVTEATVVLDRETGRSKGFGFVEMTDSAAAGKAIAELDGTKLDDYAIRVSPAQARSDHSAASNNRPRRGSTERTQRW